MKKLSKLLLFLVLVITLSSIFTISAFADDGNEESTIPDGKPIEYTNASGEVSYHGEEEFGALVTAGGKIKLLANINLDSKAIAVKNTVEIDLNGFDIVRAAYYGATYEATDNGDGTYTYTDTKLSSVSASSMRDVFAIQADSIDFKLYSSSPERGAIYNAVAKADTWTYNGTVVKRTIISYYNSNLILASYDDSTGKTIYFSNNINYEIANIDLYMQSIMYQTHSSAEYTVSIDNIKHYAMKYNGSDGDTYGASNTFMLGTSKNLTFTATDSLFWTPLASTNFFRLTNSGNSGTFASVTFTNCDIVKTQTSYTYGITNKRGQSTSLILFDNCRINDLNGTTSTASYATNGTITPAASDSSFCPAYTDFTRTALKTSKKISYTVPSATAFVIDSSSDVNVTDFSFPTKTATITFTQIYTKDITVNWMLGDEIIKTETVTPGVTAFTTPTIDPYYDETDDFRNIVYQWADAAEGGKKVTEIPGWESEYTFYAVTEIDGVSEYVAGLKGAMLNMTYMAHFAYNLYIPKVDGVEVTKIGSKTPSSTVLIYGKEYYVVNAGYPASTEAISNSTITVTYTIDGQKFSDSLTFNAILYAELAVTDEKAADIEKEAAACLVRYIHESYKYKDADHVLDDATEAVFQNFYTDYRTPADYVTEYPSNEIYTVKEDLLKDYIKEIKFTVIGTKVTFAVTLTDEAYLAGNRILFGNVGYKDKISSDGKTYYTDNRSLVNNLMHKKYSITVTDANYSAIKIDTNDDGVADTRVETNYSMATYITIMEAQGVNVDMVKALYALGKATEQVRNVLY